jgi:7,8-dihydropterin-6-yl-methyl-4-(beta-D-ribofuranosyl)aminobenzene 5'-phosphate synthase
MRVVSLIDNAKPDEREDLHAEHGLSLYLESDGRRILFDTGASGTFERNAARLGIDIQAVDALVLSHHHYDHGGGLARFLEVNRQAKIHLRKSAEEDFYFKALGGLLSRYIGLDQDLLRRHADRFALIDADTEILPGVHLLTEISRDHPSPKGNRRLFLKADGAFRCDPFDHELVMTVREADGMVIFTGCSHHGILNMVDSATRKFPGLPVKAVFGGFHLIGLPKLNTMAGTRTEVRRLGTELLGFPVGRFYTGHCTGMKAFGVLKEVMAGRLEHFPTGSQVEL